jgi:hypothetical protein
MAGSYAMGLKAMIKSGVYPEISSRFITSGRRSKIVK